MSGHILPVIFSWHLGIVLNPLAGSAKGAFDGEKFWRAWERGRMSTLIRLAPIGISGGWWKPRWRRFAAPIRFRRWMLLMLPMDSPGPCGHSVESAVLSKEHPHITTR